MYSKEDREVMERCVRTFGYELKPNEHLFLKPKIIPSPYFLGIQLHAMSHR